MTNEIHSTALVDSSAQLGTNVRVGPYAIIEANCIIGDNCEIRAHAIICRNTIMGPDNQIGYGAVIGAEPQDLAFRDLPSRVEIGARNRIREYVTIHRSSQENGATRLGDDNFLMAGAHLGHDAVVGNHVILANNTLLAGHTQVGDGAFLGGATLLHQNCRVGRLAITQGGARFSQDLPPFFMGVALNEVNGLNRVGLRRAGFSPELRRALQEAYSLLNRSELNTTQAIAELRARPTQFPEVTELLDFIASSRRGICRARNVPSSESPLRSDEESS